MYQQKITIGDAVLYQGDCLEVMRGMADCSVDSIVCDPPYLLGFMGKAWDAADGIAGKPDVWREALRVLKPGGHLLAFGAPRTNHRMVTAIEDAGFEIRDSIQWIFGSGFPKSMDVSKAIDGFVTSGKSDSLSLKAVNETRPGEATIRPTSVNGHRGIVGSADAGQSVKRDTPATPAAKKWQGFGTALKPAHEPICVARKPLIGTVAANVLHWGAGALNIDACRVSTGDKLGGGHASAGQQMSGGWERPWMADPLAVQANIERSLASVAKSEALGRWPANLIHDGSPEVLAGFPITKSGAPTAAQQVNGGFKGSVNCYGTAATGGTTDFSSNSGSAARFFYTAKASKSDRDEGCETIKPKQYSHEGRETAIENAYQRNASISANSHPTVKPTDLMAYLCRLVTPPGGTVLDIFMGSGSTGKAAAIEGFAFIGIEREAEYFDISCRRIEQAQAQGKLFEPERAKQVQEVLV